MLKKKGELSIKMNIGNLYQFNIEIPIHHLLFMHIFNSIRDYRKEENTKLPVEVHIKWNKAMLPTENYTSPFFVSAFHLHFTELTSHTFNVTKFTEKEVREEQS